MAMQLNSITPGEGAKHPKRRVGRGMGSGLGKTAGRGTKGQAARGQIPAAFEGGQMPLHMRIPKLKGFNNPFRVEYQALNLDTLEASGLTEVTPEALHAKGLVSKAGAEPGDVVIAPDEGDVRLLLQVVDDAVAARTAVPAVTGDDEFVDREIADEADGDVDEAPDASALGEFAHDGGEELGRGGVLGDTNDVLGHGPISCSCWGCVRLR